MAWLISSTLSQRVMKERPRKRLRVPPNSATRDSRVYSSSSLSTSMYGEVFRTANLDVFLSAFSTYKFLAYLWLR